MWSHLSHFPERDITTPSGRQLTMMSPAHIFRQVVNRQGELTKAHTTSLIRAKKQKAQKGFVFRMLGTHWAEDLCSRFAPQHMDRMAIGAIIERHYRHQHRYQESIQILFTDLAP